MLTTLEWSSMTTRFFLLSPRFSSQNSRSSVSARKDLEPRIIRPVQEPSAFYLLNTALCLYFGTSGTPGASNYLLLISLATLFEQPTHSAAPVQPAKTIATTNKNVLIDNLPFIIIAVSSVTVAIVTVSVFIYYRNKLQV